MGSQAGREARRQALWMAQRIMTWQAGFHLGFSSGFKQINLLLFIYIYLNLYS
jgi:hypothetical protein